GPDGRYWRLERIKYDEADQLIAKMGATKHAKSVNTLNLLFAAATVPDAKSARQLNEARGGFAWHPGMDARLEIAGKLPADEKEKTVEAFAAAVAGKGYRIQPKAKYAVRLNIG